MPAAHLPEPAMHLAQRPRPSTRTVRLHPGTQESTQAQRKKPPATEWQGTPQDVLRAALQAMGNLDVAKKWLLAIHPHLNASPQQACRRPGGEQAVLRLIAAIMDGTEL